MRPTEQPNGRSGPVNEHLGEHELPNQEDKPLEEPEEAVAGARSPSPEYVSPMDEPEEARARARSPSPEPEDPMGKQEQDLEEPEHKPTPVN